MKSDILNILNLPKNEYSFVLAKNYNFSHDITHCNPSALDNQCITCKRYIAHIQLQDPDNEEKYRDGLYSYLSEPIISCKKKEYKLFLQL